MEPDDHPPAAEVALTQAATVMLVRQGERGVEVLMLRRHHQLQVHADTYVFPGGKVDPDDLALAKELQLSESDELRITLNEPDLSREQAAAIYLAALRETYEEAGVLLCTGSLTSGRHPEEGISFTALLRLENRALALSELVPWSRWVTPAKSYTSKHRFDTRFFLCVAPPDQTVRHNAVEATESTWMTPDFALQRYWQRDIKLAPPQILSLIDLSNFRDATTLLAAARNRSPFVVRPVPVDTGSEKFVAYPGDPLHPERQTAMTGPTRLHFNDGWYEIR